MAHPKPPLSQSLENGISPNRHPTTTIKNPVFLHHIPQHGNQTLVRSPQPWHHLRSYPFLYQTCLKCLPLFLLPDPPAQASQILPRPPVCRHPRQRTGPLQTRLLQLSVFQSSRHHHKPSTASPKQPSARCCTFCALQRPHYPNPAHTSLAPHPPTY